MQLFVDISLVIPGLDFAPCMQQAFSHTLAVTASDTSWFCLHVPDPAQGAGDQVGGG